MNRLNVTILSMLLTLCCIYANGAETYTITYSEADFSYIYDENGTLYIASSRDDATYTDYSLPLLPLFATDVAINGAQIYAKHTVEINKRLIKSGVVLANGLEMVPTDGSVAAKTAELPKYTQGIYPTETCCYATSTSWDDVSILHFISSPFIYDSKEKNLYFVDSIELEIETKDNQVASQVRTYCPFIDVLKKTVVNPYTVEKIKSSKERLVAIPNTIDYVIVTSAALKQEFQPLADWKTKKGVRATIVTMEEVDARYPSVTDRCLRLKYYLRDMYMNYSIKYVLLGGDDTVVPVRGCYVRAGSLSDTTIPTDLYYACFNGNFEWNANNNMYYGESDDNINLAQSLYITRLPVRLPTEINAFTEKLINYEKNPCYTDTILMSGNVLNRLLPPDNKSDAELQGDKLYNTYIHPYWEGHRYKFYDTYTNFDSNNDLLLDAPNLKAKIANGYSFMSMNTHGGQTAWALEREVYDCINAKTQSNKGYTIITTSACLTNAFDSSSRGGKTDPCLSECFIRRKESGIIAYLGSSRQGWGYGINQETDDYSKLYELGPSLLYEAEFYKLLFTNEVEYNNYGRIVSLVKTNLAGTTRIANEFKWVNYALNPVGDPEMPIYTSYPKKFSNITFGFNNGKYNINTGVEGCRICVMSADDNGSTFYSVTENVQSLDLSYIPERCSICIAKPGYLPLLYTECNIQNALLNSDEQLDYDVIRIGSSVNPTELKGSVTFDGATHLIKGKSVILESDVIIKGNTQVSINPE